MGSKLKSSHAALDPRFSALAPGSTFNHTKSPQGQSPGRFETMTVPESVEEELSDSSVETVEIQRPYYLDVLPHPTFRQQTC